MVPILQLSDLLLIYKKPSQAPIKSFENWFPLFPSEKLAELCGFLIGDGHMQPSPRWRIDFTSNNLENLDYVNSLFFDLFGVSGKIRKCSTNLHKTYNLGVNCKYLTRTLFLCGVPTGAKVEKPFLIPKWIFTNKLFFRSFIRAYFSSEATVEDCGRIWFEHWKLEKNILSGITFVNQIKKGLFFHFSIFASGPYLPVQRNLTKKGITQGVKLKIMRRNSFQKYVLLIGFCDIVKQKRANKVLCDN